jgi:glycosyltransferase involved in cell wall biosynthesis
MLGFRADIFHCPDFLIAPTNNRNIILTINDLAFIRYPHFNFEWFVKKYTKEVNKNARIAKKIIAISASTRKDIIKFLGTAGKKVEVTHLAAGEIFKKLPPEQIDRTVYEKYKIGPRYILSVGTIEPRKNYVTLIRAFNHIKKTNPGFNFQLVIVGRTGWKSEAAYEEYNNSPCRNDIIFVGRATDDELVHIYNGAGLFVYPSVFEGFGLPVVEAMQCGIPVAASRSSSIPELIDCKQALFNPADEKDIAEKILKIVMDGKTRQELVECSERNAKRFSWKKTAEKTLEIYRQCYSSGPLNKHL